MGIDAPEKDQPFGIRSKQALANNVAGKTVQVEYNKKDRYNRIVGTVMFRGQDMNLRQIELGMAWHYKQYEREQEIEDRSKYAQAEYLAQRDNVGLWCGLSLQGQSKKQKSCFLSFQTELYTHN